MSPRLLARSLHPVWPLACLALLDVHAAPQETEGPRRDPTQLVRPAAEAEPAPADMPPPPPPMPRVELAGLVVGARGASAILDVAGERRVVRTGETLHGKAASTHVLAVQSIGPDGVEVVSRTTGEVVVVR